MEVNKKKMLMIYTFVKLWYFRHKTHLIDESVTTDGMHIIHWYTVAINFLEISKQTNFSTYFGYGQGQAIGIAPDQTFGVCPCSFAHDSIWELTYLYIYMVSFFRKVRNIHS